MAIDSNRSIITGMGAEVGHGSGIQGGLRGSIVTSPGCRTHQMTQIKALIYESLLGLRAWANNKLDARWDNDPFGTNIRASQDEYLKLFETARAVRYPEVDLVELESGYSIDRAWLDDLALHTQIVKNPAHSPILTADCSTRCYVDTWPAVKSPSYRSLKPEPLAAFRRFAWPRPWRIRGSTGGS